MFDDYLRRRAERTASSSSRSTRYATTTNTSTASRATRACARSWPRAGSSCRRARPTIRRTPRRSTGSGNRKNEIVLQLIREHGVEPYDGSVRYVQRGARRGPAPRRRLLEHQLPRRAATRPGSRTCSRRSSTASSPSASTCAASRRLTRFSPARARWASTPARRPCSRTRSRASKRGAPGTSASSSGSTGSARPTRSRPTVPTSSCSDLAELLQATVIQHPAFTVEPWGVRETGLDLDKLAQTESVFALSNGHIGLRGNLDEGEPFGLPGTYLAGFYEVRPLPYAEAGYGYPGGRPDGRQRHERQDHPAARRGRAVRRALRRAAQPRARARSSRRRPAPHASNGCRRRDVPCGSPPRGWCRSPSARSRRSSTRSSRSTATRPSSCSRSSSPTRRCRWPRTTRAPRRRSPRRCGRSTSTQHDTRVDPRARDERERAADGGRDGPRDRRAAAAPTRRPRASTESVARHGHRRRRARASRCAWSSSSPTGGPRSAPCRRSATRWRPRWRRRDTRGWDGLLAEQRAYLDDFWERADVELDGDAELQQAVRFALFHMLQAGARAEQRAIAAKGLTGPGYDGHTFWDTETSSCRCSPTPPRTPRATRLRWRCTARSSSRASARAQLGLAGAAFPWRTIHGQECSGYWPAGTAAFHVNADIADAVMRYQAASDDDAFDRRRSASSCWSRRRGCGARSATTTPPGASASTA